jgi:predicted Kef-type K+ transport protein
MNISKVTTADESRTQLMLRVTFALCFFVSVGLIVGGFFTPPMGVIDGSCLTAVGELLLFPTLLYGFRAVELGMRIKFQKGETSIEISKKHEDAD